MKLDITSAKLTGSPGPAGWAQVHEFVPVDEKKLAKRGHLFAVVATERYEEGVESVVAGRELLTRLHEEYFGETETSPFTALKNAIEKVTAEFSRSWGNVEIAAISVLGEVVYSAAGGGSQVNIFRKGNLAKILESSQEGVISASGYPQEGDFLILGTKTFFASLSPGVLKASFEGPNLQSSAESLAPIVHSAPDNGKIGAVIVKFEKKKEIIETVKVKFGIKDRFKTGFNVGQWAKQAVTFFENKIPQPKIFVKREKVDEEIEPKKKTTFLVGAILLVLLLVSIGFGLKQKADKRFKASYAETLSQAQSEFDQSLGLFEIDSQKARELFAASQEKIARLLAEEISDKKITLLDQKLKDNESRILGIYRTEPELYLDLSLLSSGFKGDNLVFSNGNLFVLDKNGKKIVRILITTKKTQVVAGPEQVDAISQIAVYEDNVYGLFEDGIYRLGEKKEKVIDKDWQSNVLIYTYAGNLYLLEKETSAIWRYAGVEGEFGTKQNWLAPGIEIDFSKTKSLIIDGNVWLLSETNRMTKLALGSPQNFVPSGIFPGLTAVKALYSNEETKSVYLLDSLQKRIVALDKTGAYQSQYVADKIGEATDLIVSEKDRKIILLVGDKLYFVELRHL